jgi:hypothetical protein
MRRQHLLAGAIVIVLAQMFILSAAMARGTATVTQTPPLPELQAGVCPAGGTQAMSYIGQFWSFACHCQSTFHVEIEEAPLDRVKWEVCD